MCESLLSTFTSWPEYIKSGIITLLVTVIAGIIVAYISTRVFQRISEVTRVKGILIERRIEVYKELADKLEKLDNLTYYHSEDVAHLLPFFEDIGLKIDIAAGIKVNDIFTSMERLHKRFLEFDNYALENRIFYDDAVYDQINFLQNYLGLFSHIRLMYEENLFRIGVDHTSETSVKIGDSLLLACGIILTENFSRQILESIDVIRTSMNEVSLKTRKSHRHTYEYYNDPEGPVMKKVEATGIREQLTYVAALVSYFAALSGEAQHTESEKTGKRRHSK